MGPYGRLRALLVCLACWIVLVESARGSGPEPLRVSEIQAIAEALGMSREQLHGALWLHEQYRAELASTLASVRTENDLESFLARQHDIERADEALFEEIRSTLNTDQHAALERYQRFRQRELTRETYASLQGELAGWDEVDLPRLSWALHVPQEIRTPLFATLDAYDVAYTRRHAELSRQTAETWAQVHANLTRAMQASQEAAEKGLTPEAMESEIIEIELWATEANRSLLEPLVKAIATHRRLTWQTYEGLQRLLPPDQAELLTVAFVPRAYRLVRVITNDERCLDSIRAAMQLDDLDAKTMRGLDELHDQTSGQFNRLIEQMAQLIDANLTTALFFPYATDEEVDEFTRRSESLMERAATIRGTVLDSLRATLPEEAVRGHWEEIEAGAVQRPNGREPGHRVALAHQARTTHADILLPQPLQAERLLSLLRTLDSAESLETEVVAAAKRAYEMRIADRFVPSRDLLNQEMAASLQEGTNQMQFDDVAEIRKRAFRELDSAETAFLASLADAALSDRLRVTMRHVQAWRSLMRRNVSGIGFGGTSIGSPDVIGVLLEHTPQLLSDPACQPILEQYEVLAENTTRTRYDLHVSIVESEMRDESVDVAESYADLIALRDELAAISYEAVSDLADHLEEASERAQRARLLQSAYPRLFADSTAIPESFWQRVTALEDLQTSTRSQLIELAVHYKEEYQRLTERLLEILNPVDESGATVDVANDVQALVRERDECNAHALAMLETLLTAEQVQSVGGLPRRATSP